MSDTELSGLLDKLDKTQKDSSKSKAAAIKAEDAWVAKFEKLKNEVIRPTFEALGVKDGGYVGNFSTATIAAAPLPIPIAFSGTFQAYRLRAAPARARGFLARLADLFAGCGRH